MINQADIRHLIVDSLNELFYLTNIRDGVKTACQETKKTYTYFSNATDLEIDGVNIIGSVLGVGARWVASGGGSGTATGVTIPFLNSAWEASGDFDYVINIAHGLDSTDILINIFDSNNNLILVDTTIVDSNNIQLKVNNELSKFSGKITVVTL